MDYMEFPFQPIPEVTMQNLRHLWRHVKQEGDCWIWTGAVRNTYPLCSLGGRAYTAHRVFFHAFKAPIPEGMTVDHSCNKRTCVNPDHLAPMTLGDNVRKAIKLDYCKRGHPLADPNLYYNTWRGKVRRRCLTCLRKQPRWKAKA